MAEAPTNGVPRSILAPGITLAATLIWAVLAIRTPTNTYHFAPIIAAVAWPFVARGSTRPTPHAAITISVASTAVVLAAGLLLWTADRLRGPTLWGSGDAVTETVIFAVVGGLVGLIAQLRHDP